MLRSMCCSYCSMACSQVLVPWILSHPKARYRWNSLYSFIHPSIHPPTYLPTYLNYVLCMYVCMYAFIYIPTYLIFWPGLQTHHLLLLLPFVLGPLSYFPSELIWYYGSYSQLANFLGGWSVLSLGRYLHRRTQTQKKRGRTSIQVGIEPTIPVFEPAKPFHALDTQTTVFGD
jgi:hypothetical protein